MKRVVDLSIKKLAELAAEAGREAVAESRRLGLPVTGTKCGWVIRMYPDGREEIIQPNNRVPIAVGAGWLPIVYRCNVRKPRLAIWTGFQCFRTSN
jgi:hypothetical protein